MPEEEKDVKMTPKRAALVLTRDWILGGPNPSFMSAQQMQDKFDGEWNYNITEKRRQQIADQFEKIVESFKNKVDNRVAEFAII